MRLQERKIGVLAQTMTGCYKKLANKKNLIDQIRMDAVTLDFEYLSSDGNVVPKESLSAGEKQLMVIQISVFNRCSLKNAQSDLVTLRKSTIIVFIVNDKIQIKINVMQNKNPLP